MVRKYKGLRRGASGRLLCPRYVMRTDSDEDSNEEQMHETQIDSQVERNEEAGKNVEGNEKERVSEKAGKDGEGNEEERGLDEAATVRKGNEEGVADEPNGDEENEETEKQDGEEENEKEAEESNEENIPLEPLGMYFKRSEFRKTIKIQSRCYIREAVHDINELLDENEKQWFHEHPQFKHFFHMHLEKKHKVQGMWILFLHTAVTSKKREAWFVVNGVPIRYSLREHGLLSGLYCHNYPLGWQRKGGLQFVGRHFKRGTTISYEAVKNKFLSMGPCKDMLQMAVLYFLSSVIIGRSKKGEKGTTEGAPSVEHFFLRAVDDLKLCKTFPWGRLSFLDSLEQMQNLFKNRDGIVNPNGWCFPSFNIPLQILPFETIRVFKQKYREWVNLEHSSCPRMCTTKFRKHGMTGFLLSDLYETLGTSTDIDSCLEMTCGEYTLSKKIFDAEENIRDDDCYIVDSWEKSLATNKSIFLETSFRLDVNGGNDNAADMAKDKAAEDVVINNEEAGKLKKQMVDVEERMMKLTKTMENGFERLGNLVDGLDKRVKRVEELVKYQGWDGETDMGFESVSCRPSRYWNDAGGSGSGGGLEKDKECTDGGGLEKDKEGVDGGGDGAEKDKDDGGGLEKDKEGADGGGDGLEKNKDDGGGLEKDKEVADGGGSGVEKDKEDADGGSAGGEHFEEAVEEFQSCDSENNEEGDSETDEESEQENDEKGKGKEIVGEKRSRKPSKFEIDPYTRIRTVKRRKKKKPSSPIPLKL